MPRIMAILVMAAVLSSCTARVKAPQAEVKLPMVTIETGEEGKFCPPGQAKKGRC